MRLAWSSKLLTSPPATTHNVKETSIERISKIVESQSGTMLPLAHEIEIVETALQMTGENVDKCVLNFLSTQVCTVRSG